MNKQDLKDRSRIVSMNVKTIRLFTAAAIVAVILVGSIGKLGYGTLCSIEIKGLAFTCPMGFLQISLASRKLLTDRLVSVGLVILTTIILGRIFCAWICPTTLLKGLFSINSNSRNANKKYQINNRSQKNSRKNLLNNPNKDSLLNTTEKKQTTYVSYAVLGGSLLSSYFFGFPVFCLICPIGLFFGSLLAVRKLFFTNMPGIELILFPLLLGLEIFALKSWCLTICPLGALLRIINSFNIRIFKPSVKKEECLLARWINCRSCRKTCPEGINLVSENRTALDGCTNCLECWEKCPQHAIKILHNPLNDILKRFKKRSDTIHPSI